MYVCTVYVCDVSVLCMYVCVCIVCRVHVYYLWCVGDIGVVCICVVFRVLCMCICLVCSVGKCMHVYSSYTFTCVDARVCVCRTEVDCLLRGSPCLC